VSGALGVAEGCIWQRGGADEGLFSQVTSLVIGQRVMVKKGPVQEEIRGLGNYNV
jgi:hypothetical protein